MVVLICTSLVGEDGKHLSMCFFAISISSSPSLEIRFQIRQLLSLHCFSRSCHTARQRDGTPLPLLLLLCHFRSASWGTWGTDSPTGSRVSHVDESSKSENALLLPGKVKMDAERLLHRSLVLAACSALLSCIPDSL